MLVVIADDHSIVRSGLRYLVGEVDPAADVVEVNDFPKLWEVAVADPKPDLIITDLNMPGFGGLDDLQRLVERAAPTPVAVFSMLESPTDMRPVLERGVKAFIPKSTGDEQVINIIRLVAAGGTYVPPILSGVGKDAEAAPSGFGGPGVSHKSLPDLTRRQREVLELLAQGLSNQEISDRLGLNLSTVKTHVTGVLKALDVENRTQAVLALKDWSR